MTSIVILDSTLENLLSCSQDVLEHVSHPKYGIHAHHLLQREEPPVFRARPHIDELTDLNTFKYERHVAPTDPNIPLNPLLPPGILGRPTNTGEQFFREDLQLQKTSTRPVYELLFSRISTSSKLLAKTQPEYAEAIRTCCPHVSRLIAHLVPISTVPSSSDKYPTSISVISYFRYSVFTVFLISCFFTLKFLALIPT